MRKQYKNIDGVSFVNCKGVVNNLLTIKKQSERVCMMQGDKYYHGLIEEKNIVSFTQKNNINLCELITEYPCRVYFDIDGKPDLDLSDVENTIIEYFGMTDMYIMGYENDKKNSYHITLPHYITTYDDLETLKNIVKHIKKNRCDAFDDVIYTKNRGMKCVFQSKPNGGIQKPITKTDLKNFFITCFIPEDVESFQKTLKLSVVSLYTKNTVPEICKDIYEIPKNISNEDLTQAKKLLEITPINEELDTHGYRWKIGGFCYSNSLTFNDFINWLEPVNPSSQRIEKLKECWKNYKFTLDKPITIEQHRKTLSQFYPELLCQNVNTSKFLQSFNLPKSISIGRIEQEYYNVPEKVITFNIGMGGGKTTTTLKYLKDNNDKSFVWLAPRQTLVLNTSHRMKTEFNIDHTTHLDVGKNKLEKLKNVEKLIICNQSLHYIRKNFKIVVIDEIETVLNSWRDEETHGENLEFNFNVFTSLLQNAEKIILLDAFTTTKTFNLLTDLNIPHGVLYTSNYRPNKKTLVYYDDNEKLVSQICEEIYNGKKLYIFYAFKNGTSSRKGIRDLDATIKGYCMGRGKTDIKSILYYAESEAKNQLGNINISWAESNYIITTSSITVGVNYEGTDYDNIYLFCSGYANQPRDIIQSSMRIRSPKNSNFGIFFFDHTTHDFLKYPSYYHGNNDAYKNLIDGVLDEVQCDFDDSLRKFCELTNYELGTTSKILKPKLKPITNEFYESKMLLEYTKTPVYTLEKALDIEELVYSRQATMEQRLGLDRFYFDYEFREMSEEHRIYVWNNNLRKYFKGIKHKFFNLLYQVNNIASLDRLDLQNIKSDEKIIDYITVNFKSSKSKSPDYLIVKTINDLCGGIIKQKKDKNNKCRGYDFNDNFDSLVEIDEKTKQNKKVSFNEDAEDDDVKDDTYYFYKDKNGNTVETTLEQEEDPNWGIIIHCNYSK